LTRIKTKRNLATVKATISKKGQLVLPEPLRERDHIAAGQTFDIKRIDDGQYLLKREKAVKKESIWNWLSECPEKDWFTPLPSESTNSL